VLEDDTTEVPTKEAIKGETLNFQGSSIDTTTTYPERAQEGDSGEGDRRNKRPTTRRHAQRRSGGWQSLRRRVEARESSDGGDVYDVGVAWPRRTKSSGHRTKHQLQRPQRRRRRQ